jgi:tetratricopeptide (TPR) repeat protein
VASLVAGSLGLALFQASDSFLEISSLANNLALTYLAVGNAERAEEFARQALARAEEFGDEQLVAHITETRSRICLAAGRTDEALEFANKAIDIAQRSGTAIPMASALAMRGRIAASRRDFERARDDLSAAASAFRLHGQVSNLRDVLGELADVLFELGDTEGGKQAYKDALGRQ